MKDSDTLTSSAEHGVDGTTKHGPTFAKVLDGRKQPIRGLWVRNGRYYAQLKIENPLTGVKKTKRIPLKDKDGDAVETVAQAKEALARLQTQRADNALPVLNLTPKFSKFAADYIEFIKGRKKLTTVDKEKAILTRWSEKVGELRLDQIKRVHVNRFIDARLESGASPRTINLDVIALRNALKRALSDGTIQRLPTEGLRPLKTATPKRALFSTVELDKLCSAASQTKQDATGKSVPVTENAAQFVDYIKLMAYSGTRRNEALGLQWEDVNFDLKQMHVRRQITKGGIGTLKNSEERVVDFNPKLEAHLVEMHSRRTADSVWVFPSPQRGNKDIPARSFRESLELVRTKSEMPSFNFHDCRHHFISMCVMSGIDFMTIAAWVGHRDGGILIGKVYGHLANEHRRNMASKLSFDM